MAFIDLDIAGSCGHTRAAAWSSQHKSLNLGKVQKTGDMRTKTWYVAALLAFGLCGCNSEDSDRLGRIGRKVADRLAALTGENDGKLNRGWAALRSGWDNYPIDVRVSMRLRWDRALNASKTGVIRQGAKVESTGTVPNAAAHQRAIDLAESTDGVESVADWIEEDDAAPAPDN